MTRGPPAYRPGQVIGHYRLDRVVGSGGFGEVFRAVDVRGGGCVALKILLPEHRFDTANMARFQREARIAQSLSHPNIVRILDFGTTADAVQFIAYELLEGESVEEVLARDGPFALDRVTRITAAVLRGLAAAHAQGIVHRDVKPSNIFLCDPQRAAASAGLARSTPARLDHVKLLDFGIAKPTAAAASATSRITVDGSMVGTPKYMSPEQIRGQDVVPASDLFSLGLLLSEAISGEPVFSDESVLKVCVALVSEDPVVLPAEVGVSALGRIIQRAVEKSLDRRYRSAAEMLADVEALLTRGSARERTFVPTSGAKRNVTERMPVNPGTPIVVAGTSTPTIVDDDTVDEAVSSGRRPSLATAPTVQLALPIARPAPRRRRRIVIGSIAGALLVAGGVGYALFGVGSSRTKRAATGREASTPSAAAPPPPVSAVRKASSSTRAVAAPSVPKPKPTSAPTAVASTPPTPTSAPSGSASAIARKERPSLALVDFAATIASVSDEELERRMRAAGRVIDGRRDLHDREREVVWQLDGFVVGRFTADPGKASQSVLKLDPSAAIALDGDVVLYVLAGNGDQEASVALLEQLIRAPGASAE